jgi:hypothetical protein
MTDRTSKTETILDQARTALLHGTPEQRFNMAHILTDHLEQLRSVETTEQSVMRDLLTRARNFIVGNFVEGDIPAFDNPDALCAEILAVTGGSDSPEEPAEKHEHIWVRDNDDSHWHCQATRCEATKPYSPLKASEPQMAMLPNDYHPGSRCSCVECLRRFPNDPRTSGEYHHGDWDRRDK